MESIEKLREVIGADASQLGYANGTKKLHELIGEIEAEISERYMELPVDADGVPIHIGDLVKVNDGEDDGYIDGFTSEFTCGDGELMPTIDTVQYRACDMRHVGERTIEYVLGEFVQTWNDSEYEDDDAYQSLIAKYADEIRGLI